MGRSGSSPKAARTGKPARGASAATAERTPAPRSSRGAVIAAALVLVGSFVFVVWREGQESVELKPRPREEERTFPSFVSEYVNTWPEVQFIGTAACVSCHREAHESFQHSGMARSLAQVSVEREPPDGQFEHAPSHRQYQVQRREGALWHREFLRAPGNEAVLLQEFPVKYVTGSGRHSLTYLVEADGFLVESPITWYTSRKAWGLSPGYDRSEHFGFQREAGEGCLICHAGQVETLDKSLHRVRIVEEAISCERCHGPGGLHQAKHLGNVAAEGTESKAERDNTIVNPAHLPRELAEAICQQCHLRTSATVFLAGKRAADFRPGLPLQSVRHDYSLEDAQQRMTVVGHVEQMHGSTCYQKSTTFTCTTCHHPHAEPAPESRPAHYRAVCLSCHALADCGVDAEVLRHTSSENDCVRCHMPQTETDIPHLAFTHHRVAVHPDRGSAGWREVATQRSPGRLKPFLEISNSDAATGRSLALAYLDLALHERNGEHRLAYQREAWRRLRELEAAGGADGVVLSSLASLAFDQGLVGHGQLAERALADPKLEGLPLCNAYFLLAESQYDRGGYREAIVTLETLGKLRRHAFQWLLRAQCEQRLGNAQGVEAALLQSVRIDPSQADVHQQLMRLYQERGAQEQAQWHAERASP